MSLTRKCLDRKHLMSKLEQVKHDISGELIKSSLAQTVKRDPSNRKSKSREKTVKALPERTSTLREPNGKAKPSHCLARSKESRESRESLLRSTHSYYIAHRRGREERGLKSYKSKETATASNIINSTFEMQSFASTHKKKKSNFSSVVGSKFDLAHLNKSATQHADLRDAPDLQLLLLKSETVLDQYRSRYEALEKENRRYKRKYQDALKKIKHLENKY